jgi:hypothetical protein
VRPYWAVVLVVYHENILKGSASVSVRGKPCKGFYPKRKDEVTSIIIFFGMLLNLVSLIRG